jgi:hypothetical protein
MQALINREPNKKLDPPKPLPKPPLRPSFMWTPARPFAWG